MNNPELFIFALTEAAFWIFVYYAIRFAKRPANVSDYKGF